MSSTTKKPPIDRKSKEEAESLLTTADTYREYDAYLRTVKQEEERKKRMFSRHVIDMGETMIQEIEQKNTERENKRLELIEHIFSTTKEKYITFNVLKDLPFEDVVPIHQKVIELKKPWWRQVINVFR